MSEERQYFCLCLDNCRFETMTKEQIIAAIAEATGATPTQIDDAFITKLKEQNAQAAMKLWIGTAAEYNAITTPASDVVYVIKESGQPIKIEKANVITNYNDLTNKPEIPMFITSGTEDPSGSTAGADVVGSIYFKIVE